MGELRKVEQCETLQMSAIGDGLFSLHRSSTERVEEYGRAESKGGLTQDNMEDMNGKAPAPPRPAPLCSAPTGPFTSTSGAVNAAAFLLLASLDSFSVSRTSCLMKPPGMTENKGGGEDGGGLLSSSRICVWKRGEK